jgi:hypothetical protein
MFLTHCNVLRADLLKEGRIRTQQKRPICPICPSYKLKGNDYPPAPNSSPKKHEARPNRNAPHVGISTK